MTKYQPRQRALRKKYQVIAKPAWYDSDKQQAGLPAANNTGFVHPTHPWAVYGHFKLQVLLQQADQPAVCCCYANEQILLVRHVVVYSQHCLSWSTKAAC